jgi:STE24 endopeptidase
LQSWTDGSGRRAARVFARLAVLAGFLLVAFFAHPQAARADNPYLESRVSSIPNASLLKSDPSALVDPRRQQVATSHAAIARWLSFAGIALPALALLYLWRSGNAARLRDALSRALGNRVAMRFCFGAVVASVAAVAAFPASLAAYRVAVSYQVTRQPPAAWATDTLGTWLLAAVVVGALTAFVYTLVERTRLWYLYAALGLFAFALAARLVAPGLAAPFFSGGRDVAPGGRAASAVSDLERKAAAGDVRVVVDADARSALATARIEGFGPNERIVLTQALVEDATPQEVTFVVARELGHHAHGDVFRLALAWALGFVLSVAVAVAVADRIGFRRDDDSISRLPLVGAIGALAVLAVLPLYNAYARRVEFDAVKYAIAIDGDRAGAVRAYVRLADEGLVSLCPTRFSRWYLLSRPSIGSEIAFVLDRPDPCP